MASRKDWKDPSSQKIIGINSLTKVDVATAANDRFFRQADEKAQAKETSAEFIQSLKEIVQQERQKAFNCIGRMRYEMACAQIELQALQKLMPSHNSEICVAEIDARIKKNQDLIEEYKKYIPHIKERIGRLELNLRELLAKQPAPKGGLEQKKQQENHSIMISNPEHTISPSSNRYSWVNREKNNQNVIMKLIDPAKGSEPPSLRR